MFRKLWNFTKFGTGLLVGAGVGAVGMLFLMLEAEKVNDEFLNDNFCNKLNDNPNLSEIACACQSANEDKDNEVNEKEKVKKDEYKKEASKDNTENKEKSEKKKD